ncbi:hypothetical protein [Mucilaginibacter sp. PAMB04168]|uniref:hypothetical protein n=1 Tax=Mucilaginibacter sp. PAMB04168 TaxID=3138567 RepID=UPI0031F717AE
MYPHSIRDAVQDAAKLGFDPVELERGLRRMAELNLRGDYRQSLFAGGHFSFGNLAFRLDYRFNGSRMELTGYEARLLRDDITPAAHWEFTKAMPLAEAIRTIIKDLGIVMPNIQITESFTGVTTPQILRTMNLNNLDDLKKELKDLGFNPKVADELEKHMKPLLGHFTLNDQFPGDKGLVDMTLHFRKSNQSDFYTLNKYEVTAGKVPPTVPGQQYMVISENEKDKQKPLVKTFDNPNEAIDFFKKEKGTSELAMGESADSKQLLASKEKGTVNFIDKQFRPAYFSPAVKQTFYIKEGQGFSARQAANLVQNRTVHRDNMLTRDGEPYKAWIRLDFDQKKDDFGNHKFKQFYDPSFGFDLEKTLNQYQIKELSDPAKKEAIMNAMKQGDRVELTVKGPENKDMKVLAEAVPRYGKLDFFNEKGSRQKREQFEKPSAELAHDKGQNQGKEQQQEKRQGVRM